MSGVTVSGIVTELQTSVAQLRILYELSSLLKRSCREFRAIVNLMFTAVILDSNLSFENHISNVTKTAFFHLRNISKLRNMLSVSDAEKLVHAFMTSRLDY